MTAHVTTPYDVVPEFVCRVKLPDTRNALGFWRTWTDEDDYFRALAAAVPVGFEPLTRGRAKWPVDVDGFTWVALRCTNDGRALYMALERAARAERALAELRAAADGFPAELPDV